MSESNSGIGVRPLEGSLRFANFAGFLKKSKEHKRACRVHIIPRIALKVCNLYIYIYNIHMLINIIISKFLCERKRDKSEIVSHFKKKNSDRNSSRT